MINAISMAWFSNWTQKHYIQNIENLNIKKTRENPKKIHAISIALSLSNSTQWKLRGFFWDFHEIFDMEITLKKFIY